jgi:CHAT domain-containing protein
MVLVVPDGGIQIVNLATLPSEGGRYLVEIGPMFHYLSTERDLVRASREHANGRGLLAFGNPDFDATARSAALQPGSPTGPGSAQGPSQAAPGPVTARRSGCDRFEDVLFAPLPGSAQEIGEIAALWDRQQKSGGSLRFAGADASEENFKRHAPGQSMLHIATHGFFLNADCPSGLPTWRGVGGLSQQSITPTVIKGEISLLLPGLALAGANHRRGAGAGEEDGILTAEEIVAIDLSGVEWAVLSACQTGLGELRDGEGVFGLRRAFQIAGVRSILMSLWSVEDVATRDWMGRVYRARMSGLSTVESVRSASVESLLERRREEQLTHPFYWGAFVAVGDWR